MQSIKQQLDQLFRDAIEKTVQIKDFDPLIKITSKVEFGEFQANFALALGKQLKRPPREIAEQILQAIGNSPLIERCELSGPGFINIHLNPQTLASHLDAMAADPRLGIDRKTQAETVVVDYSSANVAKEMHIGHIRSTILGDAICRILGFLGDQVIRQNHVGDWGTQFGMLIEHLLEQPEAETQVLAISDLNQLYRAAKQRFDEDETFKSRAQQRVVSLQAGDPSSRKVWQQIVTQSLDYFQSIYDRLNVLLTQADCRGESFYNEHLQPLVDKLLAEGIAEIDQGAAVIFLPGFVDKNDEPLPFLIQKSDRGFLYATTDLAAAQYRIETLKADRLIYVVDARQKQHFDMLFSALEKTGWLRTARCEHAAFGSILGHDHKPFKTRSGETVKLATLLDEAVKRARDLAQSKNPQLAEEALQHIANTIGIGSLKYADMANDRIKDYVFDWDKMLSFDGNTAPYLINAYVRIQSLFRKSNQSPESLADTPLQLVDSYEKRLAFQISEIQDVIQTVAKDLALHRLGNYLFQLAASYHRFYEHCPILNASEANRNNRLKLSALTAQALKLGLSLLGINTIEQM